MKRSYKRFIGMTAVCMLSLMGCVENKDSYQTTNEIPKTTNAEEYRMEGCVLQVDENAILISESGKEAGSLITVLCKNVTTMPEQIQLGDVIEIGFDGMIMETYPAQLYADEIVRKETMDMGTFLSISMDTAADLMLHRSDFTLVDVRTKEEYESGHIPGAVLLPLDTVEEQAKEILPDLDQRILVYCRSGNRSKQACALLIKKGYTNLIEIGGINSWKGEIEK